MPRHQESRTRRLAAIIVGLAAMAALTALGYVVAGRWTPDASLPAPSTTGQARVGGPFTLRTHDGRTVTDAAYRGRFMIVFFGTVDCRQACAAGLQAVSEALDRLGAGPANRFAPLFITLDPGRDTPERLAAHVARYHASLVGLTGSPEAIATLAKAYHVHPVKAPAPDSDAGYTIEHQALFYVMGPDGRYRTHFSFATPIDDIVALLKTL